MKTHNQHIASGSNKDFSHELTIESNEQTLWKAWTDVAEWKTWDVGLKDASLEGTFKEGAVGHIRDHDTRRSQFTLMKVKNNQHYTMVIKLPLARLVIERSIVARAPKALKVKHRVYFDGLLAGVFGNLLGKTFRRQLPEAMEKLRNKIEGPQ